MMDQNITPMQQQDHDAITKLTVLVETVLAEIKAIKEQMKEAQLGTAKIIAAMEAKWSQTHDGLDHRVRNLEKAAAEAIPEHSDMKNDIKDVISKVEDLKAGKNQFLGGWKTITFVFGSLAGLIGLILSLITAIGTHSLSFIH